MGLSGLLTTLTGIAKKGGGLKQGLSNVANNFTAVLGQARPQFVQKKVEKAISAQRAAPQPPPPSSFGAPVQTPAPLPPTPQPTIEHPVLAPDGQIYSITEPELAKAIEEGGKVMSKDEAYSWMSQDKSVPQIIGEQIKESAGGAKNFLSNKLAKTRELTPAQQFMQPAKDVGNLLAGVWGAGRDLKNSAVDTIRSIPDVAETARGTALQLAQGGSLSDPYLGDQEAVNRLQGTVAGQKNAIRNGASYIPLPSVQLAAGLERGVQNAADNNLSGKEGLTRGLTSGSVNAMLSAPIIPLTKGAITKTKNLTNKIANEGAVKTLTGQAGRNQKSVENISQMLQPQLNNFEKKLAMQEDRFTSGDTSKWFGKKEATIAPSQEVLQAANTVQQVIPGAAKMKPEALKKATSQKVAAISKEMQPVLKEIPLTDEIKDQMINNFINVKDELSQNINFMQLGGKQILKTFEDKFMARMLETQNYDDLWKLRMEVDSNPTIASNQIKNATELSDARYQEQQGGFYALRNVFQQPLRGADAMMPNPQIAKKYKALSDLLLAKENLINKAPGEFKGKPGLINKRNAVITGLGLVGANYLGGFVPKE